MCHTSHGKVKILSGNPIEIDAFDQANDAALRRNKDE